MAEHTDPHDHVADHGCGGSVARPHAVSDGAGSAAAKGGGHGGHSHDHASGANRTRLSIAIAIVATVLVVETVGAVLSGSLSLFADAGHMLSDLIGLLIALVATIVAARPANQRHSYGYQRAEVFGALANGLILVGLAVFVTWEAVSRLIAEDSGEVRGGLMLLVAGIGLVANFVSLMILRGGAKTSINMRGAYLEVLGDLLGSVAVIVAAGVILLTGFEKADAIASLAIAAMIVPRAISLLRDVVAVLSQSTPASMDVAGIRDHILAEPGVADVHDVHVWAITSGRYVFSAHVVVEREVFERGETGPLLDSLGGCLSGHFDVEHSTFQLEPAEHARHEQSAHE
ncbi:cation diffusion facilitator family transporter [Herbiconiux sp. KACC 21604]|uniref:cation diffusion facilitator family transporter n=1 Tax=unclassified Herbiconiux TaxID=2618217 RepID=UPI0014919B2E|nr:cation diffusion facilitator family transporter [Herbiconiux sp. SALV-R1]QJU53841.1 cation transporter [Herbiconiux sp. SALV-R1]WPO84853.1 cation diffusion facilitator family transporter [Herbiconiux sp. KACC 21604]